ncbi:hypothetical protein QIS74_11072 [Colletotrichum tabaci]|uniref:Uncharacterized protein n=1 Tax=Colletotrichum tabaci TaxID=1209068 RepID=A0AAV9SZV7_9PEZI
MQAGFLDRSYFEQPRIFGATTMREISPGWLAHSQGHSRCLQVNDNEHQWHREVEA